MFKPGKSTIVLNGKESSVEEVEQRTNINLTNPEQPLIKGNADKHTHLKNKYVGSMFCGGSVDDIIALMRERAASQNADNPTQHKI